MSDDTKTTKDQQLEDLDARVHKLENALEGLFADFKQRSDDYHGIEWFDRR